MALLKGKYMPLSEANVSPVMVSSYDGQHISVLGCREVRYTMGNYLGGGIAGVVYEAYDKLQQRHVAIKILNPVGYKLCSPATLKRGEIIKKGVPVMGNVRGMTVENVYWVSLPNRRDLIACYVDGRSTHQALRELTLEMCVSLWLLDHHDEDDQPHVHRGRSGGYRAGRTTSGRGEDPLTDSQYSRVSRRVVGVSSSSSSLSPSSSGSGNGSRNSSPTHLSTDLLREERKQDDTEEEEDELMMMMDTTNTPREEEIQVGDVVYKIPKIPAKYQNFLQSRRTIYREIAHMHKLTGNSVSGKVHGGGHENVLKLYDVLELIQSSKSTIFLVLELASGGELFDRIRSDNGVEESVARGYFAQLLSGVLYCHQLGIVHRDLKPENLLLSETDVLKIADFGLSAHFIAAVSSSGAQDEPSLSMAHQPLELVDQDPSMTMPSRFRRLNSIVGSPHYVAPEILQNARYGYDGRKADMWSIGVILYGLLVGNLPFGKDLATCARFLKFCEWIRSLPCDLHTGKLVYDPTVFQPGLIHTVKAPTSSSDYNYNSQHDEEYEPQQQQQQRLPPVYPSTTSYHTNHPPMLGLMMNSSTMLWSSHSSCSPTSSFSPSTPSKHSASLMSAHGGSSPSSNLQHGASGRRGSRVVSFPSWFFPAKLSAQAVFLLASLLHPDPAKRFSCEDTCKSNWLLDPMQE